MESLVLPKNSESKKIRIRPLKKIFLNSRDGVHYKFTLSNYLNTRSIPIHVCGNTVIDLDEWKISFKIAFFQVSSWGQKCVIEYSTD
jgi:hypothetical protein